MAIYKRILALSLVIGIQVGGKSNRSDLWVSGVSDAWQNPQDSFDELRSHNHSVNGDNLDWKAHVHSGEDKSKDGASSRCQRIIYGYAKRNAHLCSNRCSSK